MYDYAHYNEELLHNTSIVITRPFALVSSTNHDTCEAVYQKFLNKVSPSFTMRTKARSSRFLTVKEWMYCTS